MYYLHVLDYESGQCISYKYESEPLCDDLAEAVEGLGHDVDACEWMLSRYAPEVE